MKDCQNDCNQKCCNQEECSQNNQEEQLKTAQLILDKLNKDRTNGLKSLENKVQSIIDGLVINTENLKDPTFLVSTLRDLIGAINATLLVVSSHDNLINMLVSDLTNLVQNLEMQARNGFITSSHLQTLLTVLEDKKVITNEVMQETFKRIVEEKTKEIQKKE